MQPILHNICVYSVFMLMRCFMLIVIMYLYAN